PEGLETRHSRTESGAAAVIRPTALPDGRAFAFVLDPRRRGDPLSSVMLARGYTADLLCELVLHLLRVSEGLRGAATLVDVGAHLGSFSLAAAAAGHRVLAIEAGTDNVRLLRTAVAYNGFDGVTLVQAAAAARGGT